MADVLGIALGLAPFAEEAIRSVVGKNTVRNLMRMVEADLGASHGVTPDRHQLVADEWSRQRVDPELGGHLAAWLATGQADFLDRAGQRWGNLLDDRLDPTEFDIDALVAVALDSARRNLARAQESDRDAIHIEAEYGRNVVREASHDLKEHITHEVGRMGAVTGRSLDNLALPSLVSVSDPVGERLVTDVREILERLDGVDNKAAMNLARVWEAGGVDALGHLIRVPQPWAKDADPEVWVAAGQIAMRHRQPSLALTAFLTAAHHPAIHDRVRQLVRASIAARAAANDDDATTHLETARRLNGAHPALALRAAEDERDPERRLAALEAVTPLDEAQRTNIDVQRASTLVALDRWDSARLVLAGAAARDQNSHLIREARARFALAECQKAMLAGARPDRALALESAAGFRELREDSRAMQDLESAAAYAVLEASAWLKAEEHYDAEAVLEDVGRGDVARLTPGTAAGLAEVSIESRRPDLALRFAQPHDDELNELLTAEAHLHLEDDTFDDSLATVRRLSRDASDEEDRRRAAFALLMAATIRSDVPWDDTAAALVDPDRAWIPAAMKAHRHADAGEFAKAENLLLPYSNQPPVMRSLIDVAVRKARLDGEWDKATRLSAALLGGAPDDSDRLRHAELLRLSGDRDGAPAAYLAIARDTTAARAARRSAYRRVADDCQQCGDLGQLALIGAEWFAFSPADTDAAWGRLYALARLTRVADAYAAWQEYRDALPVIKKSHALLVAQILDWYAPIAEALEVISGLSDSLARPERLEYALIICALRGGETELAPTLHARVRESFETFPDRFPESRLLRSFTIDPDDPVAALIEALNIQRDCTALDELETAIAEGTSPIAVLATVVGKSVGETLIRMTPLPLGFGLPQLVDQDLADATVALDAGAAIWDPTSLYVAGGLGESVAVALRNALPGSRIGQATLDDAARALMHPIGRVAATLHSGSSLEHVAILEPDAVLSNRDASRADGMLALARGFPAPSRPRAVDGEDPRVDELLDHEDTSMQFATFIESLALAMRHGLAVYSDDRHVRQTARQIGLRAFGTPALLEALLQRGLVTQQQSTDARERLLRTGAWGLRPSAGELVEVAASTGFSLTGGLAQALLDRSAWRNDMISMLRTWIEVLQAIHDAAPAELSVWLARIVDAQSRSMPEVPYDVHARNLMALALDPAADDPLVDNDCLHAIIEAFGVVPDFFVDMRLEEVIPSATAMYLQIGAQHSVDAKVWLFRKILDRLEERHRSRLMELFVTD